MKDDRTLVQRLEDEIGCYLAALRLFDAGAAQFQPDEQGGLKPSVSITDERRAELRAAIQSAEERLAEAKAASN